MKQHRVLSARAGFLLIPVLFVAFFLSAHKSHAQEQVVVVPAPSPKIRNLKVLSENSDGKGNIIRVVQYSQGLMRVTETIIMPKPVPVGIRVPIDPDTMKKTEVALIVDKSDYCLQVLYRKRIIRTYKAVFGPRPMDNKRMEGDRCTPEGAFTIQTKNPRSQYNKFMLISYPNDSAKVQFHKLQASGLIPKNARIGGDIGIHGIWQGGDDMIELGVGWTDGCVALRNNDVNELFSLIDVGTKVVIRK